MALVDRIEITLIEMKSYLRVEHEEDNDFITTLIDVAKEQASSYLNNDFEEEAEVEGEPAVLLPVPFSIKLACLKMVASWYENRYDDRPSDTLGGHSYQVGEIPWSSLKLLRPYKKLVGL